MPMPALAAWIAPGHQIPYRCRLAIVCGECPADLTAQSPFAHRQSLFKQPGTFTPPCLRLYHTLPFLPIKRFGECLHLSSSSLSKERSEDDDMKTFLHFFTCHQLKTTEDK